MARQHKLSVFTSPGCLNPYNTNSEKILVSVVEFNPCSLWLLQCLALAQFLLLPVHPEQGGFFLLKVVQNLQVEKYISYRDAAEI